MQLSVTHNLGEHWQLGSSISFDPKIKKPNLTSFFENLDVLGLLKSMNANFNNILEHYLAILALRHIPYGNHYHLFQKPNRSRQRDTTAGVIHLPGSLHLLGLLHPKSHYICPAYSKR